MIKKYVTYLLLILFPMTSYASSIKWSEQNVTPYYGDYNGDGIQDVFLHAKSAFTYHAIAYGKIDGDSHQLPLETAVYPDKSLVFGYWDESEAKLVNGDFNGDNIDDIVIIHDASKSLYLYFGTVSGIDFNKVSKHVENLPFKHALKLYKPHVGKFLAGNSQQIFWQNKSSVPSNPQFITELSTNENTSIAVNKSSKHFARTDNLIIADFNNDNLDDIFIQAINEKKKHLILTNDINQPFENVTKIEESNIHKNWKRQDSAIAVADLDKDGYLDIFRLKDYRDPAPQTATRTFESVVAEAFSPTKKAPVGGEPPDEIPDSPRSVTVPATSSSSSVTVSWRPGFIEGHFYRLDMKKNHEIYKRLATVYGTSYRVTGLESGNYKFRVIACRNSNTSKQPRCSGAAESNQVSINVTSPPGKPILNNIGPQVLGRQFTLRWQGKADQFVIKHKSPNSTSYTNFTTTSGSTSATVTIYNFYGYHCFKVYGRNRQSSSSAFIDGPESDSKCAKFNIAPEISQRSKPSINEDSSITVSSSNLQMTLQSNTKLKSLHLSSGSNYSFSGARVTPSRNFYGELSVPVYITDSNNLSSNTIDFKITVNPVNDAPSLEGSNTDASIFENEYFSGITYRASDVDNASSELTFQIDNKPGWASFNSSNGHLSGTPGYGDAKTYHGIRICVRDSSYARDCDNSFRIEVKNKNRSPSISGAPVLSVDVNNYYSFTPTSSDPDRDALGFSITGKPSWLSFNSRTGHIYGTPGAGSAGRYPIRLCVSDGDLSDCLSFSIQVIQSNRPPTISGTPPTSIQTGESYNFTPTASDPDGDSLSFSMSGKPAWLSFSSQTGALSGTPSHIDVGSYSIRICVSDGVASDCLNFSIHVTQSNRPPTISGDPPKAIEIGKLYSFTPAANDPDNDTLTFSINNKPAWINFESSTGQISGTPSIESIGKHPGIEICVTDGKEKDCLTFNVEVEAGESLPEIIGTPTSKVFFSHRYYFRPITTNIESEDPVFNITNKPLWMAFDVKTGAIQGTPSSIHAGDYHDIEICADLTIGKLCLPKFSIHVTAKPSSRSTTFFHTDILGTPVKETNLQGVIHEK